MTKGDGTRFLYIISIKEFFNNQYIKIVKCDEIVFPISGKKKKSTYTGIKYILIHSLVKKNVYKYNSIFYMCLIF